MSKTDNNIQDKIQKIEMEPEYLIKEVEHCRKVIKELETPLRLLFIREIQLKICKIKISIIKL